MNLIDIEKEVYAHLITEYLQHLEAKRPRFILLGFDDVRRQIHQELEDKNIPVIEPELTGRLREASLLRGNSEEIGVILLSRQNLGKFASLVTAFKVLEEAINVEKVSGESIGDVHDLTHVSRWLIHSLDNLGDYIEGRLGTLPSWATYNGVKTALDEIWALSKRKPSYSQWLHPRRVIRGLILAVNEQQRGRAQSIAFFLRCLGVESKSCLNNVQLFGPDISKAENLDELKITLSGYAKVLKNYVASDVSTQRRNLANLCMNHLRMMLVELAKGDEEAAALRKWTDIFCDFEHAFKEKRRTIKKYKVEPRGLRISKRSSVSGLPKCLNVPLEVTLEKDGDRNLLREFSMGGLDQIMKAYMKLRKPMLSIKPLTLLNDDRRLTIEVSISEENDYVELDAFLEGLKSPTSYVNRLLATLKRKEK